MNRITAAVERKRQMIKDRLASGQTTQAKVDALYPTLDMDLEEFARFQELKSLAMLQGKLTEEEAQQIYVYLGETPSHFNSQEIAVKSVLTSLFHELLQWQIGGKIGV